ncbi:hypothetical protein CDLVIII_0030 [Clostridium sp. DL-VIII]|uniref:SIR2 family protein n=1 Tax=Clostridium sp. DL-VIII TaxID=641107 RepID=UPI00023AF654|nr:SIR2 family protein [Clostridium sp. DL-VIII]EHI96773.1 hypothetical protein CDLVIII_0030 [Clostridium sp. DL-VIII]
MNHGFNICDEVLNVEKLIQHAAKIGFFFGAGTSMSFKLPGIFELTERVEEEISLKDEYKILLQSIKSIYGEGKKITIEDILNHTRLVREITRDSIEKSFDGISGEVAKRIDKEICRIIYEIISKKETQVDSSLLTKFVSWLNWLPSNEYKEIFTPNYDLLLEKSFEQLKIPYFDGFVGAYEPFFIPETLDELDKNNMPPKNWIRLWKIHGSLGWFRNTENDSIVRLGATNSEYIEKHSEKAELVIYPSKDKYNSSRKQPFIAYFDKLKRYLTSGDLLFIINGYSFSDQHINEIILNSLKVNNRLHVLVFFFEDESLEEWENTFSKYINISAFSPKLAIIGGNKGEWIKDDESKVKYAYNYEENKFLLGDYSNFINFLIQMSRNQFNCIDIDEECSKETLEDSGDVEG